MQDTELIELIKNNPDRGLKILMDKYMGLLCTLVRDKLSAVCDEFEMESCVSDVFVDFYNNIDKYTAEKGSIKTLICVIAKRRAIDIFRKKSREFGKVYIDDEETHFDVADKMDVENDYINKELKKTLIDAVKSLGEPDSEIIIRKYYFGETTRQISNRLSMTINAIDTRASRALKRLRKCVDIGQEV